MTKTAEARKMLGQLTEELDRMDVLYAINERQRETIRMQRETIARLNRSAEQMQREAFERGRSDRVNPFRFVPEGVSVPPAMVPGPGVVNRKMTACDPNPQHLGTIRMTTATTAPDMKIDIDLKPDWHGIPIEDPSDHVDPATMDGSWSPAELDENKPKVVSETDRLREQLDIFRDELRRIEQHLKAVGIELKFRDDGSFVGVRATNVLFGRDG